MDEDFFLVLYGESEGFTSLFGKSSLLFSIPFLFPRSLMTVRQHISKA